MGRECHKYKSGELETRSTMWECFKDKTRFTLFKGNCRDHRSSSFEDIKLDVDHRFHDALFKKETVEAMEQKLGNYSITMDSGEPGGCVLKPKYQTCEHLKNTHNQIKELYKDKKCCA